MMRRHRLLAAPLLVAGLGLAGMGLTACSEPDAVESELPAQVIEIPGTDLNRVVVTPEAATRVGIETASVRTVPAGGASASAHTVIPLAAVLYDSDGDAWTYTSPAPLTFVRQQVTLGRVDGEVAVLTSGPPAGTAVVTVGAAELLGAEEGVGGE
jgi:hypothetical protein